MVSPMENRSRLVGVVSARSPHPSVERWDVVTVHVTGVEGVPGFANLLGERVGDDVEVALDRTDLPAGDLDGSQFDGQVTLAGPGVVRVVPTAAGAPPVTVSAVRPSGE